MRKGTDGKFTSIAGSKGYRWMEANQVRELKYENNIDMSYFQDLASVAVDTIEKFGNFDGFVRGGLDWSQPPFDISENKTEVTKEN
jgi:hypothetical protein